MRACAGGGKPKASMAAAWIFGCARRRASIQLEQPARMLAAERFRRGNFQISLTVEAGYSHTRADSGSGGTWPAR